MTETRKLAAILVADIVGYSRLAAAVGQDQRVGPVAWGERSGHQPKPCVASHL